MAKYYMTLALLLCLALENNNIYARSHASYHEATSLPLPLRMHPHPRHQPHPHVQHTSQQLQQHHTRQQRDRQRNLPDPTSEEDDPSTHLELQLRLQQDLQELKQLRQQHYEERLKRHLRHQNEHLLEQERNYHRADDGYESVESDVHYPPMLNEADQQFIKPYDHTNELELSPSKPAPPVLISSAENATKPKASGGCPKCESNRQVEQISEEELRNLRIEFVKQQILEKLRLKESPNVTAVDLPKPIFEGITFSQSDEAIKNKHYDDYYARTNQRFILLQREETLCRRVSEHPSMCFSFKIDDADVEGFDVNSAVLWLYKKQNYTKSNNMLLQQLTLMVSEVDQEMDTKYLPLTKTIAIQSVDVQDEWMKINIEWPIKSWFGNHDLSHLIQISCESCEIDNMEELISTNNNKRPFIMIDTQNRRVKSRQRRTINCSSDTTECCRERLYISFKDIGWNNWIVYPEGYDAYFCRGSCRSVASVAQAASHHSSLLKIMSGRKKLDLIPCCTAIKYSSLQLAVLGSNNSATVNTLPNMVVESCGCS